MKCVDGEGVEEFVGYDERSFVGFWYGLEDVANVVPEGLPEGTKRIFSVHVMGRAAYLLVL